MKRKKLFWKRALAFMLTLAMLWTGLPAGSLGGKEVVHAASYSISVTPETQEVWAGDTIRLTATVTDGDGNEITDLNAAGIQLWWWTDTWNSHSDGKGDASYSNYDNNSGYSLSADVTFPSVGTYYIIASIDGATTNGCCTVTSSEKPVIEGEITKEQLEELVTSVQALAEGENADHIYAQGTFENLVTAYNAAKEELDKSDVSYNTVYNDLKNAIEGLKKKADIYLEKIQNITEESIRGMDLSAVSSIFDSFDYLNEIDGVEELQYGFRDFEGNLLSEQEFFNFLAGQGVNWVRVRVWNDPYDSQKNGYGGGNNDIEKAKEIGIYATNAGMKVLVDFHYSDFWADPGKQKAPKAWSNLSIDDKADAIAAFTKESLETLIDNGVDVGMVQVGNETNGSMCGVTGSGDWTQNLDILFDAGCDAVHEVAKSKGKEILAAVHFTNPESSGRQAGYAANLAAYDQDADGVAEGVSYDVFATSYYPFWHGSLTNLNTVLSGIANTYDKKVMVAETSWANTLEDYDGHENTVRQGNNDTGENHNWLFTEQGQATEFRDVLNAVLNVTDEEDNVLGLGAFVWEGAWNAVQNVYDENGTIDQEKLTQNKSIWERFGSGWASSYATEYDPNDAGVWYGGSAIDNQSFFGGDGTARKSLEAFSYDYLKNGASTDVLQIDGYKISGVSVEIGDSIDGDDLGKVTLVYSDNSTAEANVAWSEEDIAAVNRATQTNAGVGTYVVKGISEEYEVEVIVTVLPKNLVKNYSFEDTTIPTWTGWCVSANIDVNTEDASSNAKTGQGSVHYFGDAGGYAEITQKITIDQPGVYAAYVSSEGYGADFMVKVTLPDQTEYTSIAYSVTGTWQDWVTCSLSDIVIPEDVFTDGTAKIDYTIMVHTTESAAWGGIDDAFFYLDKEELPETQDEMSFASVPQDKNYSYGEKATLGVEVQKNFDGDISYEWYCAKSQDSAGELMENALTNSITPDTTILGDTYYYCVASAIREIRIIDGDNNDLVGTKKMQIKSNPVKVSVIRNASAPVITTQPKSVNCTYGTKAQLSVAAKAEGKVSYQWYKNYKNTTIGGVKIAGATSATYVPKTSIVGSVYYYCVVVNTDQEANGIKTSSVTSKLARVLVKKAPNAITLSKTAYNVKGSKKAQTISIGGKAKAAITYTSNVKAVTVKSGKVTIPAYYSGKVTITLKSGNVSYVDAKKTVTITVTPVGTTVKKATNSKGKKAVVTWTKIKGVDGYKIQYSTKKSFAKSATKTITVKGQSKVSKTISGLKKAPYYIRICTYKGKLTSAWSASKKVSISK